MRFLLFSAALSIAGCASDYKGLRSVAPDSQCIAKMAVEKMSKSWYATSIDVMGKHISGLLLVKPMPDSSYRVVFTNEAGLTFLDFAFLRDNGFRVHHIIPQLDKRPVIRLLRQDFGMILGLAFKNASWKAWEGGDEMFYGVQEKKQISYFITDKDCASLYRQELASKRKRMATVRYFGDRLESPDSIHLQHHTFAMDIHLKKLPRE